MTKFPSTEVMIPKPPLTSVVNTAGLAPDTSAFQSGIKAIEPRFDETILSDPPDSTATESISSNAVSIFAARRKRKRNWMGGFWLATLFFASATAVIVSIQVAKNTRKNLLAIRLESDSNIPIELGRDAPGRDTPDPISHGNSGDVVPIDVQQNGNQSEPSDDSAQTKVQPAKPIEWAKSRNLSRRDLEKFWAQTHPFIVRLSVHRGEQVKHIGGVIVDSRGWVATSLSAIKGAASINVEPAPVNPLFERLEQPLSDDVRGVLAVDPVHDLVILQVNRRLVNVVTALQPSLQSTVGGRYLIQVAPPGKERIAWVSECCVNQERPREKFSTSVNRQFDSLQINLEPYWPAHDGVSENGAGAPLFSSDGKLSGINTGVSDDKETFFVAAASVFALAKNVQEPAQPLTSLVASVSTPSVSPTASSPTNSAQQGQSPFEMDHEFYQPSQNLFERAALCESFNWQPLTEVQQTELVGALLALREAIDLTRGRKLANRDEVLLRDQVEFWNKRLTETICRGDLQVEQSHNQLAWAAAIENKITEVALIATVVLPAITSPRMEDHETVTLQLSGIDERVIVPVDEKNASMLPDSRWIMVVVLDPGNSMTIKLNQGTTVQAVRGRNLREVREIR